MAGAQKKIQKERLSTPPSVLERGGEEEEEFVQNRTQEKVT